MARTKRNRRVRPRFPWVAYFIRGTVVVLLVSLPCLVTLGLWWYATQAEYFSLKKIHISGTFRATLNSLRQMSGLRKGQNLFLIDPRTIALAIEAHPWVNRASVRRQFPDRVHIDVEELEPVAFVSLESLYYVQSDARVIKRYSPSEPLDLPVITGLDRLAFEQGDQYVRELLGIALDFLSKWKEIFGEQEPLPSEVHVGPLGLISYTETQHNRRVTIGRPPWESSLRKLRDFYAAAPKHLKKSQVFVGRKRWAGRVFVKPWTNTRGLEVVNAD